VALETRLKLNQLHVLVSHVIHNGKNTVSLAPLYVLALFLPYPSHRGPASWCAIQSTDYGIPFPNQHIYERDFAPLITTSSKGANVDDSFSLA
jgi:hypothetical protein